MEQRKREMPEEQWQGKLRESKGKEGSGRKGGGPLTCRRVDDSVQIFWGGWAGATGVRGFQQ
jgi:hypothetical protein